MLTEQQNAELTAAIEALPSGTKERDAFALVCGDQPRFEDFVNAYGRLRNKAYRAMVARLLAEGESVFNEPATPALFQRLFPEAVSHSDFRDVFQAIEKRRKEPEWIDPPVTESETPLPPVSFPPEKNRGKRKKTDETSAF